MPVGEQKRTRRVFSLKQELIIKSREAALAAIQIFNNPLIRFKSESFIVLMIIAWTYLLHAYYKHQGIDYRYCLNNNGRKKYDRTKHGAYKYWELERCLNDKNCPIDKVTAENLRFLIGLRHEVEHQMSTSLDMHLSARYQACCLNYNAYIRKLFGDKLAIDKYLTFSIQLSEMHPDGFPIANAAFSDSIKNYIVSFDTQLTQETYNSPQFSVRVFFSKKTANRPGQADKVIEFIDPKSELAKGIEKEYWVVKDKERQKYLPTQIIEMMAQKGYKKFGMHQHTELWKKLNAKQDGKGYGVQVAKQWYWYDSWVNVVALHCAENYAQTQKELSLNVN